MSANFQVGNDISARKALMNFYELSNDTKRGTLDQTRQNQMTKRWRNSRSNHAKSGNCQMSQFLWDAQGFED